MIHPPLFQVLTLTTLLSSFVLAPGSQAAPARSAPPAPATTTWIATYGRSDDDMPYSLVATADGGYAVAGRTGSFGAGSPDAWVLKLDASGNVQWQKTYGGSDTDKIYSIIATADGGYAVAGFTDSFGDTTWGDAWVLKLDAAGTVQWQKTYGGSSFDGAYSLVATDGGYAVAGWTWSFSTRREDVWVLKLDTAGAVQWQKAYGGSSDDEPSSVITTADGGYALAGRTSSFGRGDYDAWVLKLDASGNVQWQKTYGGDSDDEPSSLITTTGGAYALAGWTYSFGAGNDDTWILKLDASGNVLWQKTYGGSDADWARSLVATTDGGYALTGSTGSFGAGGYNAWVLKLDASGNALWQKTYDESSSDETRSLIATVDGGFAVAGSTEPFVAGDSDSWVLKLDANGEAGQGCSLIGMSTVTDANTLVSPVPSSATAIDTTATVSNSSAVPADSDVTSDRQCVSPVLRPQLYLPVLLDNNRG